MVILIIFRSHVVATDSLIAVIVKVCHGFISPTGILLVVRRTLIAKYIVEAKPTAVFNGDILPASIARQCVHQFSSGTSLRSWSSNFGITSFRK